MSTCTTRESYLDQLKRRLGQVEATLIEIRLGKRVNKERKFLLQEKRSLEAKIRNQTQNGTVISDHAIVRYMQRVHGIDLDAIRDEIVGCDHKALKLPDGQFGVGSHKIRVRDGVVVTVVTRSSDRD